MSLVYLKHPFTMVISGPTGSGKTVFVKKMIENIDQMIDPVPEKIFYFYGEYQQIFEEFPSTTFFMKGIDVDLIESLDASSPSLLIINDLMDIASNSALISDLFTKISHHRNISVILLLQNFFLRSKNLRTITLNAQYIVLFKNPRDRTISRYLGQQMYPNSSKVFNEIYIRATEKPYSYLFIDLKPYTPENLRLFSDILGEDNYISVYMIK